MADEERRSDGEKLDAVSTLQFFKSVFDYRGLLDEAKRNYVFPALALIMVVYARRPSEFDPAPLQRDQIEQLPYERMFGGLEKDTRQVDEPGFGGLELKWV